MFGMSMVFFFFLSNENNAILFKERKKKMREGQSGGPVGKTKRKKKLVLSMGPVIFNLFTKRPFSNVT